MEPIVCMTGRLGTDVEERTSRNGQPYVTFRMASTSRFQREGEWIDGPTTWVSVRCYRALATNARLSLRKGQPVLVTGRLRTESWQDSAGSQRERTVLEAQSVGHDLSWGVSIFNRLVKEHPPADREPEDAYNREPEDRANDVPEDRANDVPEEAPAERTLEAVS